MIDKIRSIVSKVDLSPPRYKFLDIFAPHIAKSHTEKEFTNVRISEKPIFYRNHTESKMYTIGFSDLLSVSELSSLSDEELKKQVIDKCVALKDLIHLEKLKLATEIFDNAFDMDFPVMDGKPLCSTHLRDDLSDNRFLVNRIVDETRNFEKDLDSAIDSVGFLPGKPQLKFLLVPLALQFRAEQFRDKFQYGVAANPYLKSTNSWFIITDIPNGLKFYEGEPLVIEVTGGTIGGEYEGKIGLYASTRCRYIVCNPFSVFGFQG